MKALPALRNAATILASAVLAWCCLLASGILPTVRFTRERIEVTVRPSSIEVDGIEVGFKVVSSRGKGELVGRG